MDMDGIGTMALFLSSGVIGAGLILLSAYRMTIKASLEKVRMQAISRETVEDLHHQMRRLSERVDFAERLLESGRVAQPAAKPKPSAT